MTRQVSFACPACCPPYLYIPSVCLCVCSRSQGVGGGGGGGRGSVCVWGRGSLCGQDAVRGVWGGAVVGHLNGEYLLQVILQPLQHVLQLGHLLLQVAR